MIGYLIYSAALLESSIVSQVLYEFVMTGRDDGCVVDVVVVDDDVSDHRSGVFREFHLQEQEQP